MNARHSRRGGIVRLVGALALVTIASFGMVGCGDDDDSTATDPAAGDTTSAPTESPTESATSEPTESEEPKRPQCADVWVADGKLPGGYQDCYDGDKRVKANGRYCEFGKPLITHESRFWAVPGGVIHEVDGKLLDDAKYRDALLKCGG